MDWMLESDAAVIIDIYEYIPDWTIAMYCCVLVVSGYGRDVLR